VAFSPMKESAAAAVPKEEVWEVRPGGMLVQKRSPDTDPPPGGAPVPTIRVKVKFNGVYHEIYINSQASFGELKKLLSEKTGLHPDDQKVVYKDKERDSKAFLDMAGVKDRSKMVMLEDPAAKAKRLLEERRTSKAERAAKAIARVALDVDKLATKVYSIHPSRRHAVTVPPRSVMSHDGTVRARRRWLIDRTVGRRHCRCRRWRRS